MHSIQETAPTTTSSPGFRATLAGGVDGAGGGHRGRGEGGGSPVHSTGSGTADDERRSPLNGRRQSPSTPRPPGGESPSNTATVGGSRSPYRGYVRHVTESRAFAVVIMAAVYVNAIKIIVETNECKRAHAKVRVCPRRRTDRAGSK